MRYSLLAIFLVGCAHGKDPRDIRGINPEFVPYVREFEVQYGHPIGDIPIQFVALSNNFAGQCVTWIDGYKEIKIDPSFWNSGIDDDEKESLIAHELGHCVLGRAHLNTYQTDSGTGRMMPTSLMNSTMFFNDGYSDWQSLKVYYYNELFHPAPGAPMLPTSKPTFNRNNFKLNH